MYSTLRAMELVILILGKSSQNHPRVCNAIIEIIYSSKKLNFQKMKSTYYEQIKLSTDAMIIFHVVKTALSEN